MLDSPIPAIQLTSGDAHLNEKDGAFISWLAQRATGIKQLHLVAFASAGWTLPCILLALYEHRHVASAPGPDIILSTGNAYV